MEESIKFKLKNLAVKMESVYHFNPTVDLSSIERSNRFSAKLKLIDEYGIFELINTYNFYEEDLYSLTKDELFYTATCAKINNLIDEYQKFMEVLYSKGVNEK